MSQRPHENSPFKRALMAGMSDVLPVPLAEQMDPYRTDAKNLPHLAAHHSVDLWFDDWPEERKREVIAQYSGESVIYPGERLPELKGTREGTRRYLELVDATLVDVVAYPQHVVLGRTVMRQLPIGHPPFMARHLVKVDIREPEDAFVLGRSVIGRSVIKTHSREQIERAMKAMCIAKAPETEYRVSFAHKRMITIDDNIDIDGGYVLGQYVTRGRL